MWLLLWLMSVKRLLWIFLIGFGFFFLTTSSAEAGNIVAETGQVVESLFGWLSDRLVEVINS
jgi:hypothetical protein